MGPVAVTLAILLSGGIDSIALSYWKRPSVAVTVDYGQRPAGGEIQAAAGVCEALRMEHWVVSVDCSSLGSGDMAGTAPLDLAPVSEWWPYRNQLLVTLAAGALISRGVDSLLIGTVKGDSQHADGTGAFVDAISRVMSIQEGGLRVEAPAIGLTSAELVRQSKVPLEVLAWAHSCHTSSLACGRCRGCAKHFETMKDLGIGPY
jgi:7-cyano-7-deazaguanine synthase